MKKLLPIIFALLYTGAFSQNVVDFTTPDLDTLWVSENQFIRITKVTEGSTLEYLNEHGDYSSVTVRERTDDTANVASSVSIVFSGSAGAVDSIKINGVEILTDTVGFTTNISTTVGLVEDSIDNNTQTPVNYTATVSDSTLTISAPAAFGDTANGYTVIIYTRGGITATPSTTTMTGGFTVVRNILTLTDRIFNIESGAYALNADRVKVLKEKAAGAGTVIWYNSSRKQVIETTDIPATITAAIKAL